MIKKLKRKFVAINMTLILTFVTIVCVIIFVHTKNDLENKSINAMTDILMTGRTGLDHFLDPESAKKDKYSHLSTYIIDLNELNNTCYIQGFGDEAELTESQKTHINNLINAVNSQTSDIGILDDFNFRYHYKTTPVGKKIIFLDRQYEYDELARHFVLFFVVGITVFVVFLFISILLAGFVASPIEKSLKQQQQLISDASHELKTPITVVLANTEILLSNPESRVCEQSKWLSNIKDETTRMSSLVTDMLYLAKSDEIIKSEESEIFDLSSASYEAALPFESICFERNKSFEINIQPSVFVYGQAKAIKELIVILLDNAVKYSNTNGVIKFKLFSDSDKAVISVFNTGDPIPKEMLPRVFERFFRVDTSRSCEIGGNGLGLSIAKRIVETNNGKISVTSNADSGTAFIVSFKKHKGSKQQSGSENNTFNFSE